MTPSWSGRGRLLPGTFAGSGLTRDLAELLAIPSVSTPVPNRAGLARAASWLGGRLAGMGCQKVQVGVSGGFPVVVAERRGTPGAPTILCYGHFDVVGAGTRSAWSCPPFAGTRRGSRMVGRGASDDKGPLIAQLRAAAAVRDLTWKFIYDGSEEIGSPGLPALLDQAGRWLRDVGTILVCDTEAAADGTPTLTVSIRGQVTVEVAVHRPGPVAHTGRHGGAVPDAALVVARLVASLHGPDGEIQVAGLRDVYEPLPALGASVGLPLSPKRLRALERVTVRPAVTVTELGVGDGRSRQGGVVPADARAVLDVRLVPGQGPGEAAGYIARHLAASLPAGVRIRIRRNHGSWPWRSRGPCGDAVEAFSEAVRGIWGVPPAMVRSGGTIPAVALLSRVAPEAEVLLAGFSVPGNNAHGPDETADLMQLQKAQRVITGFARAL